MSDRTARRAKILAYLPRYPSKQAVTLPALHIVQDELRCVPLEAIREIADLLDLSPAEVHDTMTFYGFFRDEKAPARQDAAVGLPQPGVRLARRRRVAGDVCEKLDVQPGGTTADGKITVEFAECLGACEGAPAVLIDASGRRDAGRSMNDRRAPTDGSTAEATSEED